MIRTTKDSIIEFNEKKDILKKTQTELNKK